MKSNFTFIIVFLFSYLPVLTHDTNHLSNKTYQSEPNKIWSIHYSLGKGNLYSKDLDYSNSQLSFFGNLLNNPALIYLGARKITPNIEAYHARFLAEYLPHQLGFQFGMNYHSINVTYKDNSSVLGALLLLLPSNSSANPNSSNPLFSLNNLAPIFAPIILLTSSFQNPNFSTHLASFDFASTFHFRPRKTFDPYVNVGIGLGTCGYACAGGKIFGRLGSKINLGLGYIFIEGEYTEISLRPAGSSQSTKLKGSIFLFGFGIYL